MKKITIFIAILFLVAGMGNMDSSYSVRQDLAGIAHFTHHVVQGMIHNTHALCMK